ncbi:MAG: hypothetical protein BMS9Abin31_0391 [Gammaproteobacteria bacterium]|nr:MAG: hypothetical protein BMS9Abin31_0391 [Gammaproteobacteria bacterium]
MSITNDENLMTSGQVKRQLKSISTDKSDIKHSLLNLVEQFQCLDHIAESIGLVKEGFSFVNCVSWKTILSKLATSSKDEAEEIKLKDISETISQSSNQLENEIVPQLQRLRNNWMIEVILIEFVVLGLVGLAIAGVTHVLGLWSLSNISFSVQPFLYERPVFSLLTVFVLFISFFAMHFSTRGFVAGQIVRKLNKENSEFDLASAFLKNTRVQHSIFRPDIIGWGWINRKRLQMSQN